MVDPFLLACLEEPLNDATRINRVWLPKGKKKVTMHSDADRAEQRVKAAASIRRREEKQKALLDHYAGTSVPLETVATHVGISVDAARTGLRERGRTV